MICRRLLIVGALLVAGLGGYPEMAVAQDSAATFRSGVDVVRVSTTVRDRKGRFVLDLASSDFDVLDDGQPRLISDLRHELAGLSIAFLFDLSGSMEGGLSHAREAAAHVLSRLEPGDEVAVFTFDTRLSEVTPFHDWPQDRTAGHGRARFPSVRRRFSTRLRARLAAWGSEKVVVRQSWSSRTATTTPAR